MRTQKIYILLVIIMMSGLATLFGLNASAAPETFPRQVDLSGNIFQFSMPENFSKDMPAADMVEKLDVEDLTKFDNPEYGNIIRRWWDIKRPGFFGKALGTVMMDVSVQRVPENKQKKINDATFDVMNRLDFIMLIDQHLHNQFDQLNREAISESSVVDAYHFSCCSLLGDKILSHYRDEIRNGQNWLGYSVAAPYDQLIVGLALPLTKDNFLDVVFTYSPNRNILPREFLDVAYEITKPIEGSLKVIYRFDNEIKSIVNDEWITMSNNEVMAKNYDDILVPLFGPGIHKRLEEGAKAARRLNQEMNLPVDDKQGGSGL